MFHFYDALRVRTMEGRRPNVGLDLFPGTEPTLYERLALDQRLERVFQDAMEAISAQANTMLVESADLAGVEHLVDVGGGRGELL